MLSKPQLAYFQKKACEKIVKALQKLNGSRRMLLADEVGLGKTCVAGEVIEKLRENKDHFTVLYICSNSEIAHQNRRKLDLEGSGGKSIGRITDLALKENSPTVQKKMMSLFCLTPGTSFKDGNGQAYERRLMLFFLQGFSKAPLDKNCRLFFRGGVQRKKWLVDTQPQNLKNEFFRKTDGDLQRKLFLQWRKVFSKKNTLREFCSGDFDSNTCPSVSALRKVMQQIILKKLPKHLVILDEVQKFRDVIDKGLDSASPYEVLVGKKSKTPVLILSATPYRTLTLDHEKDGGEENDSKELKATLEFLFRDSSDKPNKIVEVFVKFHKQLLESDVKERDTELIKLKLELEKLLTQVICRTERNWYVLDEKKGVDDCSDVKKYPSKQELVEYFHLHKILPHSSSWLIREFWKSCPSILTFLGSEYSLFKKILKNKVRKQLVVNEGKIQDLVGRSHRFAHVAKVSIGEGRKSPQLWIEPTYKYYKDEYFGNDSPRKLLLFSGWRFVPKAVSVICSKYAARNFSAMQGKSAPLSLNKKKSFPVFSVCFPSIALSKIGQDVYAIIKKTNLQFTSAELKLQAEDELRFKLKEVNVNVVRKKNRNASVLWRAIMRLENKEDQKELTLRALKEWPKSDEAPEGPTKHVKWIEEWFNDTEPVISISKSQLGMMAQLALFSPANCLLRAFQSKYKDEWENNRDKMYLGILKLCFGSMRRYYNKPYVQQIIKDHAKSSKNQKRGYAFLAILYSRDAQLQAVLDEYLYFRNGNSVQDITEQLQSVWDLPSGSPKLNVLKDSYLKTSSRGIQTHFAMAFGDEANKKSAKNESKLILRKSMLREAFNSPFWPFVLATTSVGQEGLDFHLYCRDIMHWNLPSNPVDLEQREGRINRRDCLAVRASISRDNQIFSRGQENPWVFVEKIKDDRHGLSPRWVYESKTPVKIQRSVPFFKGSRDEAKYEKLKSDLTLYRLVLGQADQDSLLRKVGEKKFDPKRAASYMLNLSPITRNDAEKDSQDEAKKLLSSKTVDLPKLIREVEQICEKANSEFQSVRKELDGIMRFVKKSNSFHNPNSRALKSAVAALLYLKNPYDRVFDFHVEGGFEDDCEMIRKVWKTIQNSK